MMVTRPGKRVNGSLDSSSGPVPVLDEIISILPVDCSLSSIFHTALDDFYYGLRGLYFTPPDPERSMKIQS